jgi:hypothetical protein
MKIKKKAMRHGVWFKTLDKIDRAIVNLTIHCVEKIRSLKLAEIVKAIVNKLKQSLESPVKSLMRQIGHPLAQKISQIAQNWGNKSASKWAKELDFIQYLTIIYINTPLLFKT